ncbi:MAG: L-rhamnose isomerase [Lachnospiraceae bacterium]|nr:L-rhamnose isomerase [Lachnospiraceae bacterium]
MSVDSNYEVAREFYKKQGVDTDEALKKLGQFSISMHCWQGDDVVGFDQDGPLSGGIQTTGNYPGRARNPEELMADIEKALSLIPGEHRLNLHACYAIFEDGEKADRDRIEPKHFKKWVEFGKRIGLKGIDFNPTIFSHSMMVDGLSLTSPKKEVRDFWINHCKACIRISEYLAEEFNTHCEMNIWIPDGLKDVPADRMGPRKRYAESLDEILSMPYDKTKVLITLESKVFGIGLESYTAGSAEFTAGYAYTRHILPLMDNGHYHPTEVVSDKISSMLLFNEKLALHVTRGVRWDSDHVVLLDDETKEIAKEIVRNDAMDRVMVGLDFFDASINRISAWTVGMRNFQKAMLSALLTPFDKLKTLQEESRFTELMALQEELKTYPLGLVWDKFCADKGAPVGENWIDEMLAYEKDVLLKRG